MYSDTQHFGGAYPATASAPRVYSYVRFSTPEQQQGDSQRRQVEGARKWMERKNADRERDSLPPLVFDDRLRLEDLGVSAYRGANISEESGLGGFLSACRERLIPEGSFLVVESFDRVSRLSPFEMFDVLKDIVRAGVTLVTMGDGQEYSLSRLLQDPMAIMVALMVSARAHEESKVKGERLSEAWASKRRRVRNGTDLRLTRRGPSWLKPESDGWAERAPHADTVRRIYNLTLEGEGEHKIAQRFNEEGVHIMGRGKMWHRSTISKVLRNPAVIGTLVPGRIEYRDGKRTRVFEDPIPNAFPAVIGKGQWEAVRALKDGKAPAVRGRGAQGKLANIFAGLARCPECGATMTRVMKGSAAKGGKPKLVCTKAKAGAASHGYRSVTLSDLQDTLELKWQSLLIDIPAGPGGGEVDAELENLQAVISETVGELSEIDEIARRKPSQALSSRKRALEAALASYKSDAAALEHERALVDHGLIAARAEAFGEAMDGEGQLDIAKANACLRSLFQGVVIDYQTGRLLFQWRQGGETALAYAWVG